jgi:hypothetical protein
MTVASEAPPLDPAELQPARPYRGSRRALWGGLAAGALGTALLVVGLFVDAKQVFFSYLVAYAYLFTLVLGAGAFIMAMHAASAIWSTAVRRLAEAVLAVLPLVVVLVIPIFLGADLLYPWMHPERIAREEVRQVVLHKRAYLNLPFVIVRAVLYFTFFLVVGALLRRWSLRMDRPGAREELLRIKSRMRVLSSLALPGLAVFGTMASWDWLMSLSPDWYSTMFGLYYLAGGFMAALAVISLLAVLAKRAGYLPEINGSHFYALGRLMFAFLIFWAYTSYWQYTLSWIANRPVEAEWFWKRTHGAYAAVGLFIVFGHFAFPFFVLLSYWIKRRAWGITTMAVWIAAAHYFDVHWIIAAARDRPNPFSWMDAAAVLAVGGFALAWGVWRQRGVSVAPVYDPTFVRALEYESL